MQPSLDWAQRWYEQEKQLQPPSLRGGSWATGRHKFPQWRQELQAAEAEERRAKELSAIDGGMRGGSGGGPASAAARTGGRGRTRLDSAFANVVVQSLTP